MNVKLVINIIQHSIVFLIGNMNYVLKYFAYIDIYMCDLPSLKIRHHVSKPFGLSSEASQSDAEIIEKVLKLS